MIFEVRREVLGSSAFFGSSALTSSFFGSSFFGSSTVAAGVSVGAALISVSVRLPCARYPGKTLTILCGLIGGSLGILGSLLLLVVLGLLLGLLLLAREAVKEGATLAARDGAALGLGGAILLTGGALLALLSVGGSPSRAGTSCCRFSGDVSSIGPTHDASCVRRTKFLKRLLVALGALNFLLLTLGRFDLGLDRLEPALALALARGDEGVLLAVHLERDLIGSCRGDVDHVDLRRTSQQSMA